MWNQANDRIRQGGQDVANDRTPSVPLRKPRQLENVAVGSAIRFHANCPLAPFRGATAYVLAARQYRFEADVLVNYQLQIGRLKHFFMTIAEDAQGHYLSLSRALSDIEQDVWFGRDALGFFMEPSTAKTIRCKADLTIEGDWAAPRYTKTVDWIEGSVTQAGGGKPHRFHYNLLVDTSGEKALEVEHDDATGENRIFVTVYRPLEDIASVEAVATHTPPPAPEFTAPPQRPTPFHLPVDDTPLFLDPEPTTPPKQRPDFRRTDAMDGEGIRIARTSISSDFSAEESATLPSFLVARDGNYLSLDEVIAPEPERVRVGLKVAQTLIDRALSRNVRVRDILRDMLGLESAMSEEVIFELPLSDSDYRTLAMRYKLRPDHRAEIRTRLTEELKRQLGR